MQSEFQSQYSTKVMEHFMNPQNVGQIEDPSGVGDVGNPTCGDIMRLFIKVEDGIITDAKFMTFGCGAAIATSSMVTEMVKGKTIEEALQISNRTVTEALGGLPKVKMHCSVLSEQALRSAINDYYERQGKPSPVDLPEDEHEQCGLYDSDEEE
jgi:nitrogen fixation NifU-like protein